MTSQVQSPMILFMSSPGIGVIHETRKFIDYDDIYWGDVEENPVRNGGSTSAKIKEIADSRRRGIDPSAPLPKRG